jgi:hypothetical protein
LVWLVVSGASVIRDAHDSGSISRLKPPGWTTTGGMDKAFSFIFFFEFSPQMKA